MEIRSTRRDNAMPLSEFPLAIAERIAAQVAAPKPPPRYLDIGVSNKGRPLAQIESRGWWEWHWQRGIDPDRRRRRLDPWLRAAVIERDGYICGLCNGVVDPTDVHIDHIRPVALGGRDSLANLQVAHSQCNLRKGARI